MSSFLDFIKSEKDHTIRFGNHIIQDILRTGGNLFLKRIILFTLDPSYLMKLINLFLVALKATVLLFTNVNNVGNYAYVPFTCKSRFCPSCGVNSSINRSCFMPSKCLDVTHRHITFTIPDILWPFFRADRSLLQLLFDSSSYTLLSWFKQQSKFEAFTPGIIATLHTFGRDLKWNTHIHILVTEGAMGRKTNWKVFNHVPYDMLCKRFMTKLLFELSKRIKTSSFKKLKSLLYKQLLAILADLLLLNLESLSMMVLLLLSFIIVMKIMLELKKKIHAFDFIKRIIIHIPEKGFHMIRYYGIYAMKKTKTSHLKRIKEKLAKPLRWLDKLLFHFKCNPLKCTCGNTLKFSYVVDSQFSKNFQLPVPHLT